MKKTILIAGILFLSTLNTSAQNENDIFGRTNRNHGVLSLVDGRSIILNRDDTTEPPNQAYSIVYGKNKKLLFGIDLNKTYFNTKSAEFHLGAYNNEIAGNATFNFGTKGSGFFSINNNGNQKLIIGNDIAFKVPLKFGNDISLLQKESNFHIETKGNLLNLISNAEINLQGGRSQMQLNENHAKTNSKKQVFNLEDQFLVNLYEDKPEDQYVKNFTIKNVLVHRKYKVNELLNVNRKEMTVSSMVLNAKDIIANKVTLRVGSFPDYVFANDYDLMPLEKVNDFIKKYKHLPNMKSEREVVKDGMELKELTLKLVEKVEELTLYTIQQQKLIDNLQAKLVTLKK